MRVRGLKLEYNEKQHSFQQSHPMRVRGLKHDVPNTNGDSYGVAPHAGAWIETLPCP